MTLSGLPLVVQCLGRLCASTAVGMGFDPLVGELRPILTIRVDQKIKKKNDLMSCEK